jgi:hypothetical protein
MQMFPYHSDYGLPDSKRMEAVLLSIKYGVKRASKEANVSTVSIYKWRKDCGLNNGESK